MATERQFGREPEDQLYLSEYQRSLVAAGMKDAREGRSVDSAEMRRRLAILKERSRIRRG